MPDCLTLSFSQPANHITTHFNNIQEERLSRNPENVLNYRHILPKTSNNSKLISNLYPKSILFDYSNGTGAIDPTIYFNNGNENVQNLSAFDKIQISPILKKTKFQENFINGLPDDNSNNEKIDNERLDYWSDYSKVTYNPSSIKLHPNYIYDPKTESGINKNLNTIKFDNFNKGIESFEKIEEFNECIDDEIRKYFEESNSIDQINIILELDSSWSGVCYSILKKLIDDQLNSKSNKLIIWSYQNDTDIISDWNLNQKMNRIKNLLELGIDLDIGAFISLNKNFNKNLKLWEKSCYFANLIDNFSNFNNNKNDINEILYHLTENGLRKFITNSDLLWSNDQVVDLSCKNIFTNNINNNTNNYNTDGNKNNNETDYQRTFSKVVVCRCDTDMESTKIEQFANFDKLIETGTSKNNLKIIKDMNNHISNNSMPKNFKEFKILSSSLSVTNSFKSGFNDMYQFVSKYCKYDEREEYKNQLENLKENYTFGFEASDNEDEFE